MTRTLREGGGAAGATEYGSKHWWGEAFKTSLTPADLVCVTFTNSAAESVRDLTGAPGWTGGFEELDSFGMEDSSCHRCGTGLGCARSQSGTPPSSRRTTQGIELHATEEPPSDDGIGDRAALEFRGKLGHSILVLPGDKWREDLRLNSTISL